MARVIMLRGVSGAGKSTVAKMFAHPDCEIVSADKFFLDRAGRYQFDASQLGNAHKYCFEMFKHYLLMGKDVVVDNTNTTEKEMAKYLEYAAEREHEVVSLVVENRHGNDSVHNVPQDKREQQAKRLSQSIKLI